MKSLDEIELDCNYGNEVGKKVFWRNQKRKGGVDMGRQTEKKWMLISRVR